MSLTLIIIIIIVGQFTQLKVCQMTRTLYNNLKLDTLFVFWAKNQFILLTEKRSKWGLVKNLVGQHKEKSAPTIP